jgi:hypothetical protein
LIFEGWRSSLTLLAVRKKPKTTTS